MPDHPSTDHCLARIALTSSTGAMTQRKRCGRSSDLPVFENRLSPSQVSLFIRTEVCTHQRIPVVRVRLINGLVETFHVPTGELQCGPTNSLRLWSDVSIKRCQHVALSIGIQDGHKAFGELVVRVVLQFVGTFGLGCGGARKSCRFIDREAADLKRRIGETMARQSLDATRHSQPTQPRITNPRFWLCYVDCFPLSALSF